MVATVSVETIRSGFVEGPSGYFSLPPDIVTTDLGLYEIPGYLAEDGIGSGIYFVPEFAPVDLFAGSGTNLLGYTVQEDTSPMDPGSMRGGAGQVTFAFQEAADTYQLIQEIVNLNDTDLRKGDIQGTVRGLSGNDGTINVTVDSILALFNSDHIVPPKNDRLDVVLQSYCTIVGVPNTLQVDASIANRIVTYPGWVGNVWERLKQIASREQIEFALVGSTIIVRPLRTIVANVNRDITRNFNIDNQSTARQVEIAYYNNVWDTRQEVYPVPGEEPGIYTVDANETLTVDVQLHASLQSVNQPVCVSFVEDRTYPDTNGVYSVAGNDGLPITPSQWTGQGGFVKAELTDDPSIIRVTIKGASMRDYAPYRIAMTSGSSNYYNSLHITGTGVTWERESVTITTGSTSAVTGEDIGIVVENPFISSKEEAYNLGKQTAKNYAGLFEVSGTTTSIQPTDPEEQAFGNIAGARMRRNDAMFRIYTASSSKADVSYTAEQDTRASDFDSVWDGMTIADFNLQWSGRLIKDFNTAPMRRNS